MALSFTVAAVVLGLSGRIVDDEAGLAWLGVRAFLNDPLPVLFFQKLHPANMLLLAPATLAGWTGYLVAHALLAGATLLAIAGATRRLGGSPTVAALVLALSPPFIVSAASGQSNTSGMFLFSLSLWLALGGRRARLAAGLLLGFALWSRYELAPLICGLSLFLGIHRRDRRAVMAVLAFPAAYLLMGAAWHRDLLWALRLPPAVPELVPMTLEHITSRITWNRETGLSFLRAMAIVTPAWVLAFLEFARIRDRPSAWIGGCVLVSLLSMVTLPLAGHFFNFEFNPRYLMVMLPGLAVGAGLAIRPFAGRNVLTGIVLATIAVGVALWEGLPFSRLAAAGALPFLAAGIWAVAGRSRLLVGIPLFLMLASSAWFLAPTSDAFGRPFAKWRPTLARTVASSVEPGTRIFTNVPELAWSLEAPDQPSRVRFLLGYDMLYELWRLLNHNNGQSQRVVRAIEQDLYGTALWPCDAARQPLKPGDLLVFGDDRRAEIVGPLASWKQFAPVVARVGRVEVRRVERTTQPAPLPPVPDWLAPEILEVMCPGSGRPSAGPADR